MAFLHRELRKTINNMRAYASNRSFLEFITDSLRDIGIGDQSSLPFFQNKDEEQTVKELLEMRDHLYEMRDLAFTVKAHESILDRAHAGEIDLALAEIQFHQKYVEENKPRVQEYYSAAQTPVELIDEKLQFLQGLRAKLSPTPWSPDVTPRPALFPLIHGIESYLKQEKDRILSETIVLDQNISGFSDDFFRDFFESYSNIPSWSRPEFRVQWARNIPSIDAPPNVDFLTRPTEVSTVSAIAETDASTEASDEIQERPSFFVAPTDPRLPRRSLLARSVSESEADLFGEDSDSEVEILPSPRKRQHLETV